MAHISIVNTKWRKLACHLIANLKILHIYLTNIETVLLSKKSVLKIICRCRKTKNTFMTITIHKYNHLLKEQVQKIE